jgi:hypothetical protein
MFGFFKRRNTIKDPVRLREALFSAIQRNNEDEFIRLCNENRRLLVESFDQWRRVPESLLDRPLEVNAYLTGLVTIARYFSAIGEPGLMVGLIGDGNNNPIVRWREMMTEAHARTAAGDYVFSKDLLLKVLSEMEHMDGTAIDEYRSRVYGLLGTNFFSLRDLPNARKYTALALEECKRVGDGEGVRTYTENMALFSSATDQGDILEPPTLPVARFRRQIARAQDLSDDVRYVESNDLLQATLREMDSLLIGSHESFRGKLYGLLGLNLFRLGKLKEAEHYTQLALTHCTRNADEEGIRIYSVNIAVIAGAQGLEQRGGPGPPSQSATF